MKRYLITIGLALLLAVLLLNAVGCNTIEGAGEDIEAAGEGIEDAAD